MKVFWYYGLRLHTELALEGLPPWPEMAEPDTDLSDKVELSLGDLPERLEPTIWSNPRFAVGRDGDVLVTIEGRFRALVTQGCRIQVHLLAPPPSMAELESWLLSMIAGALLHQRGELTLHASAFVIDGEAVALTGRSGKGKSTLAAALVRRGHQLLSDDITVVRRSADGKLLAVPGSPHLRLHVPAALELGAEPAQLFSTETGTGKSIWRRRQEICKPVPLRALLRIEEASTATSASLTRLRGAEALMPLPDILYRFNLAHRLGKSGEIAGACLRMAETLPIYRLIRPAGVGHLDRTAELLEQTFSSLGPDQPLGQQLIQE